MRLYGLIALRPNKMFIQIFFVYFFYINKSNVFLKPFLHQLMSQSAVQKPSLKRQTASNAGVEARWLGNSLERPKPRKKPREEPGCEGWPVLFWQCQVEIITEHGQDVQIFIMTSMVK
jgi:hypothetical protein